VVSGAHTYALPGSYTVTVTVDDGRSSSATTTTAVVAAAPVEPEIPDDPDDPDDPVTPDLPTVWTPSLQVLINSATRGTVVPVDGEGFAPGEQVSLTLFSDPIALGTLTANADGIIRGSFTVPLSAATGEHEVEALGSVSKVAARAAFEVVDTVAPDSGRAPLRPGSNDGSLAYTGGDRASVIDTGLVAGMFLAAGGLILAVAAAQRRSRRYDPDFIDERERP
jgi:PKD repeat protein